MTAERDNVHESVEDVGLKYKMIKRDSLMYNMQIAVPTFKSGYITHSILKST